MSALAIPGSSVNIYPRKKDDLRYLDAAWKSTNDERGLYCNLLVVESGNNIREGRSTADLEDSQPVRCHVPPSASSAPPSCLFTNRNSSKINGKSDIAGPAQFVFDLHRFSATTSLQTTAACEIISDPQLHLARRPAPTFTRETELTKMKPERQPEDRNDASAKAIPGIYWPQTGMRLGC
ncbi:hypothetical protein M407DRAFT_33291 [Tulasnella calospora MUT 4182]|uniref:Uncharacterized protein n=1 Tax=Tulasnella calospora MUT 4182 TaxID=1051891 RepID=A0A0C3PR08_9AGAM|nr:hypothetical protein M407DRAFT_33291 [Tulasnella calospora MUT 4182]